MTTTSPTTITTTLSPTTEVTTISPTTLEPTTVFPTTIESTTIAPTTKVTTVAPTTISSITYTTDFSEYTTGVNLSDWTDFWSSGGFTYLAATNSGDYAVGSKLCNFVQTSTSRKVLTWDDIGNVNVWVWYVGNVQRT